MGGLAEATVSGAVAGGVSVAATMVIIATGGTGLVPVIASVAGGGAAGGIGYGAGEVAENVISPLVGDPDQSSPSINDALISIVAGGAGGTIAHGAGSWRSLADLAELSLVTPGVSLAQGSAVSATSSNLVTSLIPESAARPLLTHPNHFDGPSDLIYEDY